MDQRRYIVQLVYYVIILKVIYMHSLLTISYIFKKAEFDFFFLDIIIKHYFCL
jgi:hypothetical protein